MLKLVLWELQEYRGVAMKMMSGIFAVAVVVSFTSHLVFGAASERVVEGCRLLLLGALGGNAVALHVSYFSFNLPGIEAGANTLMLHAPVAAWRVLVAKQVAALPVLVLYLATDTALTLVTGYEHLLPLYDWQRILLFALLYFLGVALALNALVVRTAAKARIRFGKALGLVVDGVVFAVSFALFVLLVSGAYVLPELVAVMAAPLVQALLLLVLASALTWLNAHLLEHVANRIEI